jgi:subtilisin family serine protease
MIAFGLAASIVSAPAQANAPKPLIDVSELRIKDGVATDKIRPASEREVTVLVRLQDPSVAGASGAGFKQLKRKGVTSVSGATQRAHAQRLAQAQAAFVARATSLGAKEIARLTKAVNGVAMKVRSRDMAKLRALPGVVSVRAINDYQLDLSETVPYIGAKAVQDAGVDGSGVTVAVLDSGIDYTHKNLGGEGTLAAYAAAYGTATTDPKNTTLDGLFPTAKVVGGYDFVGEEWPLGDRTEDPDPIDCGATAVSDGCDGGHGTHVADIIGGKSNDGTHKGVAPGAKLLAVKVCSAVSPSCNGVSLLLAIDFSLDPNGDGDLSDAADVINLSLGSSYGQTEDDLSYALGQASQLGVVVVASAGNSADRPYITGQPSTQPEVISVAQTHVPSAVTYPLVVNINGVDTVIKNTNTVPWAPIGAGFSGDVVYVGRGCPAAEIGADDPYVADPNGKVALIDRGACSVSSKVDRAARAGATAVLVANNVSGDPPSFSLGSGDTFVPTMILTQADGNTIKAALAAGKAVKATVSSAVSVPLVGSMVASSSRGPSYSHVGIKPDIGAPGASLSAEVGTGTEETAFGGTSGAAPMVAGAAALLLSANPNLAPRDVKSLLVTTADDNIQTNPATLPGVLAPITRIGGGEVRVNKAVASTTTAWAADDSNPALSFGYRAITASRSFSKRVVVKNWSDTARTYTITPSFRYADDAASGAVTPSAPATLNVPARSQRSFVLTLNVDASKLPNWSMNGGSRGGLGSGLQAIEFDGYLNISDATDNIHVPWHILPRKAASPEASSRSVKLVEGEGTVTLQNSGAQDAVVEVFTMNGTSNKINKAFLPGPGDNRVIVDLKAVGTRLVGFSDGSLGMQFAIATNGLRSHPNYPAEFDIYIDVDRVHDDPTRFEYVIFNAELGNFAADGRCAVFVADLTVTPLVATPYFFCDADLNSGNMIFTVPLETIGLNEESMFTYDAYAFDNYFTGELTDEIIYNTHTVSVPRFYGDQGQMVIPPGGSEVLTIGESEDAYVEPGSTNGILLMYRQAPPNQESEAIRVR